LINSKIFWNKLRNAATSVNWNVTWRPWHPKINWRARLVHSAIRDHLGDQPAERIRIAYGRTSGEDWRGLGRWGRWRGPMHSIGAMIGQTEDGAALMCSVSHMS
jgi:hypothetical protein